MRRRQRQRRAARLGLQSQHLLLRPLHHGQAARLAARRIAQEPSQRLRNDAAHLPARMAPRVSPRQPASACVSLHQPAAAQGAAAPRSAPPPP